MKSKIGSIESKRLVLETRQESHANELYELLCEKDLYEFIARDIPPSREGLATRFKKLEHQYSPDGLQTWLGWVGRDKVSQAPVGVIEITIIDEEAYIAYTIFKELWGNGYAVEATQAVMNMVTQNYKIKRYVIEMDTRNRNSVKIAEKLDFEFVKIINNACFVKNFVSHEFQFQKLN